MSCTKACGRGSCLLSPALAYFCVYKRKGTRRVLPFAPAWLRVDRTEMKPLISSLGQFEQTVWYPPKTS